MVIRHRKSSLFYKTRQGAHVGDLSMSLIQTCRLNRIDPWHYLDALNRNREAVAADSLAWLPWNDPMRENRAPPPDPAR